MSRPIEFRVWNTDIKKMSLSADIEHFILYGYFITSLQILMQFTGLLDRNGKKIFEGDILKTDEGIYEVKFEHAAFIVEFDDGEIDNLIGIIPEDSEIIGNIYEKPELLT